MKFEIQKSKRSIDLKFQKENGSFGWFEIGLSGLHGFFRVGIELGASLTQFSFNLNLIFISINLYLFGSKQRRELESMFGQLKGLK